MIPARLRVQMASAAPAEYVLEGEQMIIGRATTSAIVIADASVSRQHARLVRRDGGWWVEDLGARNRTLVNGAPLDRPQLLRIGDRLEIGSAMLRLMGADGRPTVTTPDPGSGSADTRAAAARRPGDADSARMRTVNEVHRAMAGSPTLAELLDLILARCFDALDPEEGVILLRGRDGTLSTAASRRLGGGETPVTVPRRLVDEVVGKATPALVQDAMYDDRFAGSASVVSSGIRSIVAAPIVDAEGTLGLITLCSRMAVRQFTPPDLDMLVTIASAAGLRVRNVALAEELAARRVVEHELELAHDVQMAMLPRTMPVVPGLDIAAALEPARSVGGDLYDVFVEAGRLWFIVGDVAGKSIAAALYMAIARALFRATARGAGGVADVAARMNEELARDNERVMFVTAAFGCLELATGRLSLVDAGHLPPCLVDAGGVRDLVDIAKGPALGVLPGAVYHAADVTWPAGAVLVLYTDGLTDARSENGELFGEERLREALAGMSGGPAAALVAGVLAAVGRFVGGALPEDDVTLLALRYEPSSCLAMV